MSSSPSARTRVPNRRRRGTAMVEFVLVLPFLIIILMLIVFFGHSMMRKQQVVIADRHFAWRHAKRLGTPRDARGDPDYRLIRDQHFNSEPVSMSLARGGHTPRDARQGLVAAAHSKDPEAGRFADDVIFHHFPGDVSFHVGVTYPPDTLAMDQFGRDVGDRYYREGVPWQRRDVSIWGKLRDHYIDEFDSRMVQQGATGLIARVRNLYLAHW